MSKLVPVEIIANKIVEIRGKKVMLDRDLVPPHINRGSFDILYIAVTNENLI